ncbi:DNA-binding response regulator [Deinococcus malanensis]|uniref:DNA-binding response regulator n=1 Tax=Deinococcus malanensis TaxID=1706855 RepID=A0ABQ2F2F7_9DEIO|nr:response regulator transcription factor [Deinococcus malanensis]GGK40528.1 DNA-binding response regulator [Deinococcus malanensis]
MQRILVVDDDPGITSMLRRGLAYDGYTVNVAGSGEEALEIARTHPPDLVVLDVMMPNMDGLQVLWRLRAEDPQLCVILLTARDAAEDQVGGLEAGADDYVVKPFTFEILRARIRALLRRSEGGTADVLSFGNIVVDVTKHQVWQGEREVILTAQEFKVLRVFVEQPERVMSKSMLLSQAWDPDYDGDDNIVEVYVKQLRQKLEVNDESRVIHTIRGAGYVLRA